MLLIELDDILLFACPVFLKKLTLLVLTSIVKSFSLISVFLNKACHCLYFLMMLVVKQDSKILNF